MEKSGGSPRGIENTPGVRGGVQGRGSLPEGTGVIALTSILHLCVWLNIPLASGSVMAQHLLPEGPLSGLWAQPLPLLPPAVP